MIKASTLRFGICSVIAVATLIVAGVVVREAADGSGLSSGTRVVCLTDWEGWAERAAVPSHRMAPSRRSACKR